MAERNMQVLERVREEMNQRPDVGSAELFEMAKEMDPSLGERKLASFHASYVLPIKREHFQQRGGAASRSSEKPAKSRKQARSGGKKKAGTAAAEKTVETAAVEPAAEQAPARRRRQSRKQAEQRSEASAAQAPAGGREQIRSVFLEFAREFAEAESRTEIVQVLSKVDDFVDRVLQHGR
jgi:hypothetical protein